jgi:membrane protein YdbS with pleckstrin-like domain
MLVTANAQGGASQVRSWRMLRVAFIVLAVSSVLLLIWELVDDGWSATSIAFICNVVTFWCLSLIARSREKTS